MKYIALAFVVPLLLCAQMDSSPARKTFAEFFEDFLQLHPEAATSFGRTDYDDRWSDWSAAGLEQRARLDETYLARLKTLPLDGLPERDRISVEVLRSGLEKELETHRLGLDGMLRVSQLFGAHTGVFQTIDQMPARTARDYENIIARINATPAYVDQTIALFDSAIAHGLTQPKVVADLVIQQLSAQVNQTPETAPILSAFRRFPASIPKDEQERLKQQGSAAFERSFLPAWRKLLAYMTGTYALKVRAAVGVNTVPEGDRLYAYQVRIMTTTRMTPKEIHELGLKEVARIEVQMEAIARETGFNGSVADFETKLEADPAQHFHSEEEMLEYCRNIVVLVEPELPRLFKLLPRTPLGVRAIPPDREAATASHYTSGTPDVTRPGYFNLQAYQPEKQVKYDKTALVMHEGVPGHHLQISLTQETRDLPDFRKLSAFNNSAYTEGWALYAESLGEEIGVGTDPYTRFGRLASERFRAVRLVVDTGLHNMGWTREQAQQYFREHAPSESMAEIDRYIAWPGQALAYKIGQLKIRELRTMAEQRLGPKFDVREFHDLVLRNGVVPLEVLEQFVTAHLSEAARP
jgi:prolyl oligopeptidase